MEIQVLADAEAAARKAAAIIAAEARAAAGARGRAILALSGGHTPWLMLAALGGEDIPWDRVHVVQVDERVAPAGHPDRNFGHLHEILLENVPISAEQIHPMPVEAADLEAAAARYARTLAEIAGSPPVIDVVHLGLGPDGHTASLAPGDPVLDVIDAEVAVTGVFHGRRRMTLTYRIIDRARRVLWLIDGTEKAEMLKRLLAGDRSIPAGRVRRDHALVIAYAAAADKLQNTGTD